MDPAASEHKEKMQRNEELLNRLIAKSTAQVCTRNVTVM